MKPRLLFAACSVAACLAQGPGGFGPPPPGPPPQPRFDEVKAYLGLTDTQLQALQQLVPQQGDAMRQLQSEIEQKQGSLRDLLQKGTTDAAAVGGLMLDIEALRRRMEQLRTAAQAQARATLTDAQKAKLKALEDAVALGGEIHEATMLFLLSPPAPMFGPGFGTAGPIAPRGVPRMRR